MRCCPFVLVLGELVVDVGGADLQDEAVVQGVAADLVVVELRVESWGQEAVDLVKDVATDHPFAAAGSCSSAGAS